MNIFLNNNQKYKIALKIAKGENCLIYKSPFHSVFVKETVDEKYRKVLQALLIYIMNPKTQQVVISPETIAKLLNISAEEADAYFNIFDYTTKFLEIMKKKQESDGKEIKIDKTLELTLKELISFSDFSILSSKVPLLETDFVKCEDLIQIKQRYPFLFRFTDGKWKCSILGDTIGKEFKSFSKLNTIPLQIVLGNTVIKIKKEPLESNANANPKSGEEKKEIKPTKSKPKSKFQAT